jgi:hypothetical protein
MDRYMVAANIVPQFQGFHHVPVHVFMISPVYTAPRRDNRRMTTRKSLNHLYYLFG